MYDRREVHRYLIISHITQILCCQRLPMSSITWTAMFSGAIRQTLQHWHEVCPSACCHVSYIPFVPDLYIISVHQATSAKWNCICDFEQLYRKWTDWNRNFPVNHKEHVFLIRSHIPCEHILAMFKENLRGWAAECAVIASDVIRIYKIIKHHDTIPYAFNKYDGYMNSIQIIRALRPSHSFNNYALPPY